MWGEMTGFTWQQTFAVHGSTNLQRRTPGVKVCVGAAPRDRFPQICERLCLSLMQTLPVLLFLPAKQRK